MKTSVVLPPVSAVVLAQSATPVNPKCTVVTSSHATTLVRGAYTLLPSLMLYRLLTPDRLVSSHSLHMQRRLP